MIVSDCPGNRLVYICCHVFKKTRDVNLVMFGDDQDLSMTCGGYDHSDGDYHGVGLGHLTDRDASLLTVPRLRVNQQAERQNSSLPWIVGPLDEIE